MVWGIGTGRCGTMSLAEARNGWHIPITDDSPIREMAIPWALGHLTEQDEQSLLAVLAWWATTTEYSILVNWYFSYILPLIEKADPNASFVYVWRDPIGTITSMIRDSWWFKRDVRPLGDAVVDSDIPFELLSIMNRYIVTNRIICEYLENTSRPYEVLRTADIGVHTHKGSKKRTVVWRDGAEEKVKIYCRPIVERIHKLETR